MSYWLQTVSSATLDGKTKLFLLHLAFNFFSLGSVAMMIIKMRWFPKCWRNLGIYSVIFTQLQPKREFTLQKLEWKMLVQITRRNRVSESQAQNMSLPAQKLCLGQFKEGKCECPIFVQPWLLPYNCVLKLKLEIPKIPFLCSRDTVRGFA